jgi:uncharacterized cupin superfamily protein
MMAGPIINLSDMRLNWLKTGSRFEVGLHDIDRSIGVTQLGVMLHVVPAGKTAWPFHRHHGKDEVFMVVAGRGVLRTGERRLPIRAGDFIGAPAGGEAHQIINTSDAELRYVAFANHMRADVMEYPDSGKMAVVIAHGNDREPASILDVTGRFTEAPYWDGEDIGETGNTAS